MTSENPARTCHELAQRGVTVSGEFLVDPDGPLVGENPITVHCDFTTGSATTVVPHDKVGETIPVTHCSGAKCYNVTYKYKNLKQIGK